MYMDFHTHGKLAKYLPFSPSYTDWLFGEASKAGLNAVCLTEHFNTMEFDTLYRYIAESGDKEGDSFICGGIRIFPGMETDIAEGGHVLSIGPLEAILELNERLGPYRRKETFLPARRLFDLFSEYPVLIGGAHPFREGSNIPKLSKELLSRFDFLDLNGKDLAENRMETLKQTDEMGKILNKPVVAGSDTHQAMQYGCIKTKFQCGISSFEKLREEMSKGHYTIEIDPEASLRVKTAGLVKRALKEIDALGGDYVATLLCEGGETPAVETAKRLRMEG